MRAVGHGAGKEEDRRRSCRAGWAPAAPAPRGGFWGGFEELRVGSRRSRVQGSGALPVFSEEPLCHSSVAVSLIFLTNGNNRQD